MAFIFLGGIFLSSQKKQVEKDTKGIVQNAADALQKALLNGLSQSAGRPIHMVNLPFIGSFPQAYRRWWFPGTEERLSKTIVAYGVGFINVRFVRIYSRFLSAFAGLRRVTDEQPSLIVVYSAYLPFLSAALLYSAIKRDTRICLILPDLPEFMGEGGIWRNIVVGIQSRIFDYFVPKIDYFVLLTAAMAERLGISATRYTVVEGMFDGTNFQTSLELKAPSGDDRVFLYTGTLAKRYGIMDLLDAFRRLDRPNVRLLICGEGDARDEVVASSQADARIEYLGQVTREEALKLQRRAHVLVNPRRPEGEFTRYSFPSKTLEYLAAGRPVIMHALPGMPSEYLEYILCPPTPDVAGLASALNDAAEMTEESLQTIGSAGRNFVLTSKSPVAQCRRIVDLIFSGPGRDDASCAQRHEQ